MHQAPQKQGHRREPAKRGLWGHRGKRMGMRLQLSAGETLRWPQDFLPGMRERRASTCAWGCLETPAADGRVRARRCSEVGQAPGMQRPGVIPSRKRERGKEEGVERKMKEGKEEGEEEGKDRKLSDWVLFPFLPKIH